MNSSGAKRRHPAFNSVLSEVRRGKVEFLVRKYGHKKVVPSTLRGVPIEEQDVSASFTTEPRCYGGVSIDSKEKELLGLSPKFAVYGKVDFNDCMGETEKCFAKIRWP